MNRVTAPYSYIQGTNYRGTYIPGPTNLTIQNSVFGTLWVHESNKINIIANTMSNSTGNGLDMINCANIAIVGNTASFNQQNGMFVSCSNVMIANNAITDNIMDGTVMNGSNYTLSGNYFSHNAPGKAGITTIYRMAGLYVDGVNPLRLINNRFDSDGLVITPNIMATAELSNNLANGNPILIYHNCQDVNIDNIPVGQLMIANCNRVRIANLHILNTADGFEAYNQTNASISNNQFSSNNIDGILIVGARNVTIVGNTLRANREDGINIGTARLISLQDNIVEDSGGSPITPGHGSGIVLNANDSVITRNTVERNQKGGLDVTGNNLTMSFNVLARNGNQSVLTYNLRGGVTSSGQRLLIADNNASGNYPYGVGVLSSINVNVTENLAVANYGAGILLENSFPATVFHNTLINNLPNAAEYWQFPPSMNFVASWSSSYPSGGNYFSDYTGTDSCHGPNQDRCSSPDGIGATPYQFGGAIPSPLSGLLYGKLLNNSDRYPLMKPYSLKPDTDAPTWPSAFLRVLSILRVS